MMFLTFCVRTFLKRFFPILALAMLLAIIAISTGAGAIADVYFRKHPNYLEYSFTLLMLGTTVLGCAQYSVIRGRGKFTWWIAGVLVICLAANCISYFKPGLELFSLVGMLSAASALACYNSRRYRQMCKRLQVIRRMREEWIAYEKLRR